MKCFSFERRIAPGKMTKDTLRDKACAISWEAFLGSKRRSLAFLHAAGADCLKGCVLLHSMISQESAPGEQAQFLLLSLGIDQPVDILAGISEDEAYPLLMKAFQSGYLRDVDEVLNAFGLLRLRMPDTFGAMRSVDIHGGQSVLLGKARRFAQVPELEKEVSRIFGASDAARYLGHPLHYLLEMPKHQGHADAVDALLSSLYRMRRIQRKHYLTLHLQHGRLMDEDEVIQDAIESSAGGALVLDFITKSPVDDPFEHPYLLDIPDICPEIRKHAGDVLFILCIPKYQNRDRAAFREMLPDVPFLLMGQERLSGRKAREYLDDIARSEGAAPDEALYRKVENGTEGFFESELRDLYKNWYSGYLRQVAYPQYADVQCFNHQADERTDAASTHCKAHTAYDKLQSFIGLANAKSAIDKVLSAHRAGKLYTRHGISGDVRPMHMVFTGNPGTAKTSVARMYAQILREEGILREGELIEVSRADLVGKYVGWTARLVKEHIRKAKGSVLLIDEAYALMDRREGLFGEEAINTLVMEMENCREDTVIILAGYPEPMEELLRFNPGLRSRIGFHIPFEDYSPGEMLQILYLMAQEQGFLLDQGVARRTQPWLEQAASMGEAGNGRFVRNLLDKARMKQAERLLALHPEELTDISVKTLMPQDFDPPLTSLPTQMRIGFQ